MHMFHNVFQPLQECLQEYSVLLVDVNERLGASATLGPASNIEVLQNPMTVIGASLAMLLCRVGDVTLFVVHKF